MAVHALIFNVYTSVFLFIEPVEFVEFRLSVSKSRRLKLKNNHAHKERGLEYSISLESGTKTIIQ